MKKHVNIYSLHTLLSQKRLASHVLSAVQLSPFAAPRTRAKPVKHSDAQFIVKYSDAQFIVKYSDAQFIVKYSDAQFIAKYSDAQFIVKYSDAQSIAKYSDTHFVIVIRIRIFMFITTTSTKHIYKEPETRMSGYYRSKK